MSRNSRKNLPGQFHHIMSQGINKEYIFNNSYLKQKYKDILYNKIKEININIMAYCIMDNHVHLLLNIENNEDMSKFMKQVNTSYAMFYNNTHNRVGYVFRNRFLAKPIFSERQLRSCIVYIHKNPVAAKMVEKESEYKFSSYNDYFMLQNNKNLISKNAAEIVFGTNKLDIFEEEYKHIHNYNAKDLEKFDDIEEKVSTNIEDLLERYRDLSENEKILKLNSEDKLSERKLAEIFKKSRYQIRKVLDKK